MNQSLYSLPTGPSSHFFWRYPTNIPNSTMLREEVEDMLYAHGIKAEPLTMATKNLGSLRINETRFHQEYKRELALLHAQRPVPPALNEKKLASFTQKAFSMQQLRSFFNSEEHCELSQLTAFALFQQGLIRQYVEWPGQSGKLVYLTPGSSLLMLHKLIGKEPDGKRPPKDVQFFLKALRKGNFQLIEEEMSRCSERLFQSADPTAQFIQQIIRGNSATRTPYVRAFMKVFPTVWERLCRSKYVLGRGYYLFDKYIYYLEQYLAGQYHMLLYHTLFSERLYPMLGWNALVTSLHQGILCPEELASAVQEQIELLWQEQFGYTPKLHREVLLGSQMR